MVVDVLKILERNDYKQDLYIKMMREEFKIQKCKSYKPTSALDFINNEIEKTEHLFNFTELKFKVKMGEENQHNNETDKLIEKMNYYEEKVKILKLYTDLSIDYSDLEELMDCLKEENIEKSNKNFSEIKPFLQSFFINQVYSKDINDNYQEKINKLIKEKLIGDTGVLNDLDFSHISNRVFLNSGSYIRQDQINEFMKNLCEKVEIDFNSYFKNKKKNFGIININFEMMDNEDYISEILEKKVKNFDFITLFINKPEKILWTQEDFKHLLSIKRTIEETTLNACPILAVGNNNGVNNDFIEQLNFVNHSDLCFNKEFIKKDIKKPLLVKFCSLLKISYKDENYKKLLNDEYVKEIEFNYDKLFVKLKIMINRLSENDEVIIKKIKDISISLEKNNFKIKNVEDKINLTRLIDNDLPIIIQEYKNNRNNKEAQSLVFNILNDISLYMTNCIDERVKTDNLKQLRIQEKIHTNNLKQLI